MKINGKLCYLWRAVDHEGEVLETMVTAKRDKAAALKLLKRIMKKYGQLQSVVTDGLRSYPAAMKEIGNADRHEVGRRLNNRAENSTAISTTRTSHAALSECKDTTKVQFNSRAGPQSFQPGASSRDPRGLQAETLGRAGRVAHSHGLILTGNSCAPNAYRSASVPILSDKAAELAFWHSTGVRNAKTLGRAKAVCEGLSAEEILISKGIPVAVSLLVGTALAKASSR